MMLCPPNWFEALLAALESFTKRAPKTLMPEPLVWNVFLTMTSPLNSAPPEAAKSPSTSRIPCPRLPPVERWRSPLTQMIGK